MPFKNKSSDTTNQMRTEITHTYLDTLMKYFIYSCKRFQILDKNNQSYILTVLRPSQKVLLMYSKLIVFIFGEEYLF